MQRVVSPSGVQMVVPGDWTVSRLTGIDGLAATELAAEGFRANAVLVSTPTSGAGFREWQNSVDELLPAGLAGYQVIDLEHRVVAGHEGGHRLAQYLVAGRDYVCMEQWFALDGEGIGHTLTATVETFRYSLLAQVFGAIAESLVLPEVSL